MAGVEKYGKNWVKILDNYKQLFNNRNASSLSRKYYHLRKQTKKFQYLKREDIQLITHEEELIG